MSPHHLRLRRHDQPLVDDRVDHALGKSCGQWIIAERKVARDRRSGFVFVFLSFHAMHFELNLPRLYYGHVIYPRRDLLRDTQS